MKKILVVDESQAVRETIHMVLGGDFSVAQRPSLEFANFPAEDHATDLLIVGIAPASSSESSIFSSITERFSCPVLFLVDSSVAAGVPAQSRADYLAKPFNPYELKQKVARLLAEGSSASTSAHKEPLFGGKTFRYLEYPYVPAFVSTLARKYAQARLPLLILAEAGSGQEPLARAVHALNDGAGRWLSAHCSEASRFRLRDRISGTAPSGGVQSQALTLFLSDLDGMDLPAQSTLIDFLAEEEKNGRELWLISSSKTDLLEKVYRG
jgi:DNA-binding NtrC family response regulator